MKKIFLAAVLLCAQTLFAQVPEGVGQGYDGEWGHVSQQLIALAEATPAEKFAFRPVAGVRSTSEVYMHIAMANFYFLSLVGQKMPADMKQGMDKTMTSKADVMAWLKRSLEAVKTAHAAEKPKDLQRQVTMFKRETTADNVYLRAIVHSNEHMGQMIAYARMSGVVPPWSKE